MGLDSALIMAAFSHTMQGAASPLDERSYQEALDYINYTTLMNQRRYDAEMTEKTARLELKYMQEQAAHNDQIKFTQAGFCYEVLKSGSGPTAQQHQRITFDYRGYNMLTGELLDQTYGNGGPITVTLNENIFRGLWFGLQLMQAGSIYRFYFPNALVFGRKGGNGIPPYTGMIYEIELHQIHLD